MALIGALVLGGFVAAAVLTDESDDEIEAAIDTQNASTGGTASESDLGEVSTFDLRIGDCFRSEALLSSDEGEVAEVDRVECDDDWDGRVAESFLLEDGEYPGVAAIDSEVYTRCPAVTGYYLFPTEDTWDAGDRTVLCIELR
jgi:hypothetical protein